MTLLVDINCPACERTAPVRKVDVGRYRCTDCELAFTREDLGPR